MTILFLVTPLVFLPVVSTFVDRVRLPEAAWLVMVAAWAAFYLLRDGRPLVLGWLWIAYLSVVSVSALWGPCLPCALSRLSVDLAGAIVFWYAARWAQVDAVSAVTTMVAVMLVGLHLSGIVREAELVGGIATVAIVLLMFSGQKWWKFVLAGLLVAFLFYANRRADLAALVVAIAVVGGRTLRPFALMAGLGGAAWMLIRPAGSALVARLEIWSLAGSLATWQGVGRGNLPAALYPIAQYTHEGKLVLAFFHNDYLDLLVESGPVALMIYWLLLVATVGVRAHSLHGQAVRAALLTVLVRGLFHSTFVFPAEVAWFWLLAGLYWRANGNATGLFIGNPRGDSASRPPSGRGSLRPTSSGARCGNLPLGLSLPVPSRLFGDGGTGLPPGDQIVFSPSRSVPYVYRGAGQPSRHMGHEGRDKDC